MEQTLIPNIFVYNPLYYCHINDCDKFNLNYEFACDEHKTTKEKNKINYTTQLKQYLYFYTN